MPTARQAALLGSGLTPYVDLNFAAGAFKADSLRTSDVTTLPGWSFTRASTATYFGSNGLLQTASSGTPRFVYDPVTLASLGILVEEARTNVCLWNRDLTNAVWTATNVTPVKDQTGIDGVANSASKITATAGNGTILQAVTLASSARQQSAYVKRVTGTGVVEMTTDNGTTWTAVTVTASWARVTIPVQTLANPTVGFRIVTSGDAIAVDFVQNETGEGASSPIPTTTASVTRAADVPLLTGLVLTQAFSIVSAAKKSNDVDATGNVAVCSDGTNSNRLGLYVAGTVMMRAFGAAGTGTAAEGGSLVAGSPFKQAVSFDGVTTFSTTGNGGVIGRASKAINSPVLVQLNVGQNAIGSEVLNGTISSIRVYNRALSDAQLQSLTS